MNTHSRSRRQQGFSLVELMIAMAIGLVVMGAVFVAYIAANASNRQGRAIVQMTEDATSALAVMRAQVAMGGYSQVLGLKPDGKTFRTALEGPYLFGCQGGVFTDTGVDLSALACPAADASAADSIAVTYEANEGNSMVGGAAPAAPLDCVGNKVQAVAAVAGPPAVPAYNLAYHRFYLDNNRLMCRGNPANAGQPLVENIRDLQIQYGVQAAPAPGQIDKQRVAYYADAATVSATPGLWGRVAAVRICVVMQSQDDNVMDQITSYTGCFPSAYGDTITPSDRRAYRAFTTTIVLNSRLPPDPPVAASGTGAGQ